MLFSMAADFGICSIASAAHVKKTILKEILEL
jgi:hypothetical protein